MEQTKRSLLLSRWSGLKNERSSWMTHWQEISRYLLPRSGRYFTTDRNKGERRHNDIYDSTGTRSLRILAAGMMSGMTSPARPWFRLQTADPELNQYQPVKIWLNDVTMLMLRIFQKSNTYRALHGMYEELGAFGTAASLVMPDFKNVIHHYPLTIGEYAIATNWKGEVTTVYREFQKTVGELVGEFGYQSCSQTVRNLYDRGQIDQWIDVIHVIEPRSDRERDTRKRDAQNMPWKSIYFELGEREDKFLRESGYRRFPAVCPRWSTSGGDIYGNSPGMEALGDIKQLQHEQLRKAEGIDYKTKPPLQAPSSFKNRDSAMLPGSMHYVDQSSPNSGIKTAFETAIDLQHLLVDIQDVRQRIESAFYADMFLMMANQTDARMTATEVAERHEEKLLMLGPVLERLQNELLDPLIEITFDRIVEAGLLPPPPEALQGSDVNVELISMLAQAQRAIGVNSIDRFVGSLGAVAQFKPDVLDKVDADQWVDIYSEALGIDPALIVSDEDVALIRQSRAEQQAAMQETAQMSAGADIASKLGNIKTDQPNALADVTRAFSGYT